MDEYDISDALTAFIDSRETYVAERSRLGAELKQHSSKLTMQFAQYKATVDHVRFWIQKIRG